MSKRYKIVFLIRFFGYFLFFVGISSVVFVFGPLIQVELGYRIDKALGVKRTIADIQFSPKPQPSAQAASDSPQEQSNLPQEGFEKVQASENVITPISTEYGIVIEKINANSKVIAGVNPASEAEYIRALKLGVAEALGSTKPGEPGNLYLFSHSTDAPWNIVRYNAIFYLLRELEQGDRVIIFYNNQRFDYIVFDKIIAQPSDVSYLTNRYDTPVLTLQTCDPPGTLLKRLIIRAKLVSS